MNSVLEEILQTQLVSCATGEKIPLTGAISAEMGAILQAGIRRIGAARTLEVGLCYGVSSLFICEATAEFAGATHVVMDPNQSKSYLNAGLTSLQRAGYADRIEFYEDSSHRVLPRLEAEGRELDFAFIDASHIFDYTLVEFFYIDRMLRVGGIIGFDDVQMPAVSSVCRFILTNRKYKIVDAYPAASKPTSKQMITRQVADIFPAAKKALKPEHTNPPFERSTRLLLLEKLESDTRAWDYFEPF